MRNVYTLQIARDNLVSLGGNVQLGLIWALVLIMINVMNLN